MDRGAGLRRLLDDAHAALAAGDAPDAERRAKAVSALVRAESELASYLAVQAPSPEEDEESIRAELRSRIARIVEADRAGYPAEVLERLATQARPG